MQKTTGNRYQFQGFFVNPCYDDPSIFLICGPQTEITDEVRKIALSLRADHYLDTLRNFYVWMRENLTPLKLSPKASKEETDAHYAKLIRMQFQRSAHEVVTSRVSTGCSDAGLVVTSFARSCGVPAVFVHAALDRWVRALQNPKDDDSGIRGHAFIEVYIENHWYLLDSTTSDFSLLYDVNQARLQKWYIPFAKSIEPWDSGIVDLNSNRRIMRELFADYKLS